MRLTNFTGNRFLFRNVAGIAAAVLTLIVPLVINRLDDHVETSQSLCPFKMMSGLPCPGCGITKSLIFLYRGEVAESIQYHILGIPLVMFCICIIGLLAINLATHRLYFRQWLYSRKLAYALAAGLISYHSVRLVHFITTNNFDQVLEGSVWK